MKYEHIIWDFNGTLMMDAWLTRAVMNDMLALRGLEPLSARRYAEVFDFPVREYYRKAGLDLEKYTFEMLSNEFMAGYLRRMLECSLREEAEAVLRQNRENGLGQSIISAAEQSMVENLLAHYGIREYFIAAKGLDNHHAAGKTDIGVQWVEELGVEPGKILMVGDTVHDHEVALAMGVDCVLVFSGHQSRERLTATGLIVVDRLDEIDF